VKIPTIRFYEQIGLLPISDRAENGRRVYDEATIQRLSFIRNARDLGLTMESVRTLLAMAETTGPLADDDVAVARQQLVEIEAKLARLATLRKELKALVQADSAPGGLINALVD
jgi:DNA-binding transcriptional MerR regulator